MVGLAQGVIRSITERHENCVGVKQPKILRIHCSTNAKSNVRQQWNADLADAADKNRIQTRVYPLFPPPPRSKMLLPLASVGTKYLVAKQFSCRSVMSQTAIFSQNQQKQFLRAAFLVYIGRHGSKHCFDWL